MVNTIDWQLLWQRLWTLLALHNDLLDREKMKQELPGDKRKVVREGIEQVRLERDDTIELYNADMERGNEEKEKMQALKNDILQNVEKMFKGRTR